MSVIDLVLGGEISILGDLCRGTEDAMIVKVPFSKPEAPMPATARAIINIFEEVATAQRREPSSKMEKKARKVH